MGRKHDFGLNRRLAGWDIVFLRVACGPDEGLSPPRAITHHGEPYSNEGVSDTLEEY